MYNYIVSTCVKYVQLYCEYVYKVCTIRMWVHIWSMYNYIVSTCIKYVQLECEYVYKVCTIRMWVHV